MPVAVMDSTPATTVTHHDSGVVDVNVWLRHAASLRRPYTATSYQPRHRADGPAL